MSIPKIIHYCWFGGKPKPELAEKCIRSWKKHCPDYEIHEWNEENFDVSKAPRYVQQAYEARRWAFVSDYVRLKALTEMGGVYMDTDVEVIKSLDPYLKHQAFAGFENEQSIQTGLLACEKEFPLFLSFLDYYSSAEFLREDGTADTTTNVQILSGICKEHGFIPNGQFQQVEGLAVYPKDVFCPVEYDTMKLRKTRRTVTIHWFSGSWHTEEELEAMRQEKLQQRREKISNFRYGLGRKLFGEKGYEQLKKILKRK